jgi:hypothetical protein
MSIPERPTFARQLQKTPIKNGFGRRSRHAGFAGLTLKELKIAKGDRFLYPNELSPRLTELVAMQLIFPSGRRRDGCSVYVAQREHAR